MRTRIKKGDLLALVRRAELNAAELARDLRDTSNPQERSVYHQAIGRQSAFAAVLYALEGDAVNLRIYAEQRDTA